ncbi:SAF domain-containing protein [Paenibacillus sp. GCM10023252]|uniref:SAF domain-containing protein n=1 Tax=Paenibacillus sp. GCM10023252 TaxID=3252649 RepID=UPI00361D9826
MNRRRQVLVSVTAAVMSGLLVYGIHKLQLMQMEKQEMVQIVVPKRFIAAGERLEAGDMELASIARGTLSPEMVTDPGKLQGLETVVPLGSGEPILNWKVEQYRLLPHSGESTFQIPKEYVLSVSNGIRAGDRVVLYVSGDGLTSSRMFQEVVTVASVKSSGNVEIDDPDNPNLLSLASGDKEKMYASRRDANGMIDYVNLNLTENQWLQIDSACKGGESKLVIAYSPESLEVAGSKEEGK